MIVRSLHSGIRISIFRDSRMAEQANQHVPPETSLTEVPEISKRKLENIILSF
jgi:hypothetical protein